VARHNRTCPDVALVGRSTGQESGALTWSLATVASAASNEDSSHVGLELRPRTLNQAFQIREEFTVDLVFLTPERNQCCLARRKEDREHASLRELGADSGFLAVPGSFETWSRWRLKLGWRRG
jgi:hypothetical protein